MIFLSYADVAQLVEQRIRNAWVGSSSLPIGKFCILTWVDKRDENSTKRKFCQSSSEFADGRHEVSPDSEEMERT